MFIEEYQTATQIPTKAQYMLVDLLSYVLKHTFASNYPISETPTGLRVTVGRFDYAIEYYELVGIEFNFKPLNIKVVLKSSHNVRKHSVVFKLDDAVEDKKMQYTTVVCAALNEYLKRFSYTVERTGGGTELGFSVTMDEKKHSFVVSNMIRISFVTLLDSGIRMNISYDKLGASMRVSKNLGDI